MTPSLPLWIDAIVAALLLAGAVLALTGAIGLVRYRDFFQRMHPPALAATLSAACVTFASIVYFSALERQAALYPLLINVLLALSTPVTTVLLARAARAGGLAAGADAPPPAQSDAPAGAPPRGPAS
jgi:multicomponent K+:H+ antiporter subunit G